MAYKTERVRKPVLWDVKNRYARVPITKEMARKVGKALKEKKKFQWNLSVQIPSKKNK